jgi:RNA recognition motif-containing protein
MSDSDGSDYVVDLYVKPETVRHTYRKDEDLISGSEDEKSGSGSEDEGVEDDTEEAGNSQNQEEPEKEPARPNNRFILYVTNLSSETTKSMLQDFFGDCGMVKSIRIPKVRLGCFAFVEMVDFAGFKVRKLSSNQLLFTKKSFQNGLKLNNKDLDGKKIQVYEGSKNKKHTSAKTKNLKRKNQQKHLDNLKPKRNKSQ